MELPKRKPTRLKEYDYSQNGCYFITICTHNRKNILSNVIGWLKYNATRQINEMNDTKGNIVFQRSFHDHIIRDKNDYQKIWNYIDTNPIKWREDCFYTE